MCLVFAFLGVGVGVCGCLWLRLTKRRLLLLLLVVLLLMVLVVQRGWWSPTMRTTSAATCSCTKPSACRCVKPMPTLSHEGTAFYPVRTCPFSFMHCCFTAAEPLLHDHQPRRQHLPLSLHHGTFRCDRHAHVAHLHCRAIATAAQSSVHARAQSVLTALCLSFCCTLAPPPPSYFFILLLLLGSLRHLSPSLAAHPATTRVLTARSSGCSLTACLPMCLALETAPFARTSPSGSRGTR